jgi:hypothetical protein
VPEAASSWFLPRLVGIQQALEWCYTGRIFGAEEALKGGLVRSVHPQGELMDAAIAIAREIADNTSAISVGDDPGDAVAQRRGRAPDGRTPGRQPGDLPVVESADAAEGVQSFLERRPPAFPGKVSRRYARLIPGGRSPSTNEADAVSQASSRIEPEAPPGARELLLRTASDIMREGDIVDISLSELSLRSGLNSALVKYYFGNKAGLMKALLDRDMAAITGSVEALLHKDMDPEAKLKLHLGKMVDTYYATPYLNRLLMRLVRESDAEEARRIADTYLTAAARRLRPPDPRGA